jgi:hypothetical protein
MKKKQFLKFLLSMLLVAGATLSANSFFKEHKTKIISISGNTALVKNFSDVNIGSSGVIVHRFNKNHSSIVAKIIVVQKIGKTMKVRFLPFNDLKQAVLPVPKILPQDGDIAILNYMYNHSLIIAPNYQTYKNIENIHSDIRWLHPDLFAAKLFADNNPSPGKQAFQKMCKEYSFSLLYFAIGNSGYFVDCNSFKILSKEPIKNSGEVMLPFYSRVKDIKASWLSFGKSKIDNYNTYYKSLLR